MLVSALISSIKFEGRANATTEYDSWLLDILNEEMLLLVQKKNHQQFKTLTTLSFTAGVGFISLPSDFLRLVDGTRLKFYKDGDTKLWRNLVPCSELQSRRIDGTPVCYDIKDNTLYVYPYSLVLSSDRIDLPYYKVPDTFLTSSTVENKFAGYLKHRVIARLLVLRDSKSAAVYQQLAQDKFIHAR